MGIILCARYCNTPTVQRLVIPLRNVGLVDPQIYSVWGFETHCRLSSLTVRSALNTGPTRPVRSNTAAVRCRATE